MYLPLGDDCEGHSWDVYLVYYDMCELSFDYCQCCIEQSESLVILLGCVILFEPLATGYQNVN